MDIQTKWDVDNEAFIVTGGEICPAVIESIAIVATKSSTEPTGVRVHITYNIQYWQRNSVTPNTFTAYSENKLFKTKEEAAEAWLDYNEVKC